MLPPKSTLRKKRAAAAKEPPPPPSRDDEGDDEGDEGNMFDRLPDDDDDAADGSTINWERGDAAIDGDGDAAPTTELRVTRRRRYDLGLRALRDEHRDEHTGEVRDLRLFEMT